MSLLVFIDDLPIDLFPGTAFQITFNSVDIGELTTRTTDYTNSIDVPLTETNLRIFGYPTVNNTTSKPYQKRRALVLESGVQIFNGTAYVTSKYGQISITLTRSDVDVFELLGSKLVSDARDIAPGLAGDFDSTTFYNQRNSVSTVCAPVVNWGKLNNLPSVTITNSDFTGTLTPWENRDNDQNWVYNTNAAQVAVTAANRSSILHNATAKMFQGFKYQIVLNVNLSANVSTGFYLATDKQRFLMDTKTTSGNHTITYNVERFILLNRTVEDFGFLVIASGNVTVRILDVSLLVDYDDYIQIDPPFYLPMYNYLAAIELSLEQFTEVKGFNLANINAAQSAYLDSLLLAYSRSSVEYSESYNEEYDMIAEADGTQVITASATNVIFANVTRPKDIANWFSGNEIVSLSRTDNGSAYGEVTISMSINITSLGAGSVKFTLEDSGTGGTTYDSPTFTTTGVKTFSIETKYKFPFGLQEGIQISAISRQLKVYLTKTGGGAFSVTISKAQFKLELVRTPRETYSPALLQTFENVLYAGILLPDISAYDFFKDFLIRTGGLPKYDPVNKEIDVYFLNNIIADKSRAKDWTAKRVNTNRDGLSFSLDGYAQTNYFQDSEYHINDLSRASLNILNENIETETVYYESQFNTIQDEDVKGLSIANLNAFDQESERLYNKSTNWNIGGRPEEFRSEERLALIKTRDNVSTDPVVYYGSTLASTFKVGNYAPWTDFKKLFYDNIEEAFYKAKIVEYQYNLSVIDISSIDMYRLIYDDGSYYLPLQVQYSPGQVSKVRMMKVNTQEGVFYRATYATSGTGSGVYTGLAPSVMVGKSPGLGSVTYTGIAPTIYVGPPL